jgi:hypothetical protein
MNTRIICLLLIGLSFIIAFVAPVTAAETELQTGLIKGDRVNLRSGPGFDEHIILVLQPGLPVTIVEESAPWYKIQLPDGQTGWVYRQFVQTDPIVSPDIPPENSAASWIDAMLAYARSFLGTSYKYGGDSPHGFDCSGFIKFVLAKFGVNLPHEADLQMGTGAAIQAMEDLIPGDLVFFKTMGSKKVNHVGIYMGDNCFIHAASGYGAVRISPLDSGYYYRRYVGGRRLTIAQGTGAAG